MTEITNQFQLTWQSKKTFEILATVPWDEIEKGRKDALGDAGQKIEVKGFRKGKAPENFLKEEIGKEKLLELTLQKILPDYYQKAVSSLGLRPILTPRVKLISAKENEPWQIMFISCEEPDVNLGNYKEELKKIKAVEKIWVPGKDDEKKEEKKEETKEEKIDRTIEWLIKNIKVEASDQLIEEEISRKLSGLLEQTQKLGITIDQYLASVNKTVEQIKEEYRHLAEETLSLEFILGKIADSEKIEVRPEEIQKIIDNAKNEEEKKAMGEQKYLMASLLRRQKTLDFLASL